MKTYNNRQELTEDIDFLKMTIIDLETTARYVDELFPSVEEYISRFTMV